MKNSMLLLTNMAVTDTAPFTENLVPWVLTFTAASLALVILVLAMLVLRVAIQKSNVNLEKLTSPKKCGTVACDCGNNKADSEDALPDYVVPIVKKSLLMVFALLSVLKISAQDASTATQYSPIDWSITGDRLNFALLGVIGIEVLVMFYFLRWLRVLVLPVSEKKEFVQTESKTNRWWDRFNKSVSIDKEQDVQLDHDYDGIKELDNSLPPWWIYGFYFTILFAGVYMYRYHISKSAPLQVEELAVEKIQAEREKVAYMATLANNVDETSIAYNPTAELLTEGKAIFVKNCVSCHGPEAQGASIGPNLTDEYWIHKGGIKDIFKTIKNGVQEKGMIPWGQQLSNAQIAAAATFIKSLQESHPANPKAPQGDKYEEESENTGSSDSLAVESEVKK
jgi:cytochrome c oxidase cbb3-type subunit 3